MVRKICEYCGNEFNVKDSRSNARFCSNECYHNYKSKKGIVVKKCKCCGKEFESKKSSNRIFCSRDCYREYYKGNRVYWNVKKRVKVICQYCGKEEYVTESRAKKYKYCSKQCEAKARTKDKEEVNLIEKVCPICGKHFYVKPCEKDRRVCCSKECDWERRRSLYIGENNPNYKGYIIEDGVRRKSYERYKDAHQKIVFDYFNVKIPSEYHIHHKDANPSNNELHNLVVLPNHTHMLIHRWFGNILLNAITHNKIDRKTFFSLCNDKERELYKNIIDLDVTNQAVVKWGELLENPEMDNQQPSVYRNIYVGSTTNSRALTYNDEGSNADTSALLANNSKEDIV